MFKILAALAIISLSGFLFLNFFLLKKADLAKVNWQSGDLIFIDSGGRQGQAISLATKSKWTHMGIIFMENNQPIVYHAVDPVRQDPLENFLKYSRDGQFVAKRLTDSKPLTGENLSKMKQKAQSWQGLPYDYLFSWDDDQMYCSEYVWKIYKEIGLEIGPLLTLKDFDLSNPFVQKMLQERYGSQIPYTEKVIPPSTMFESKLLTSANP